MSEPVAIPLPSCAWVEDGTEIVFEWILSKNRRVLLCLNNQDEEEGHYTVITGPGHHQTCSLDDGRNPFEALIEALATTPHRRRGPMTASKRTHPTTRSEGDDL